MPRFLGLVFHRTPVQVFRFENNQYPRPGFQFENICSTKEKPRNGVVRRLCLCGRLFAKFVDLGGC